MNHEPDHIPRNEAYISEEILIGAIAAALELNSAVYVAGPLATGLDYYNRIVAGEDDPIVRPTNEAVMRAAVRQLRDQNLPVIDPSTLAIPEWSATRVGDFYIKVMKCFAREVRLMPGWEFSSGATKEYGYAIIYGKRTLDLVGNEIAKNTALDLVAAAAARLDALGITTHKLHLRVNFIARAEPDPTIMSDYAFQNTMTDGT